MPRKRADNDGNGGVLNGNAFLRKVFELLEYLATRNNDVGGWSADGTSFIVSNQELFAEQVIPLFYKHNNIQSFVRQLNFYGFRKLKTTDSRIWMFRHPQFQRSKPDQISEIKRSVHYAEPAQEITELKSQVVALSERLAIMEEKLEQIVASNMERVSTETHLSNSHVSLRANAHPHPTTSPEIKKRRKIFSGTSAKQPPPVPAYELYDLDPEFDVAVDDFENTFRSTLSDLSAMAPDPDLFFSNPMAFGSLSANNYSTYHETHLSRPPSSTSTFSSSTDDDFGGFGFPLNVTSIVQEPPVDPFSTSSPVSQATKQKQESTSSMLKINSKFGTAKTTTNQKFTLIASDDGSLPTPAEDVPIPSADEIKNILMSLSPALHERFVETLASVIGSKCSTAALSVDYRVSPFPDTVMTTDETQQNKGEKGYEYQQRNRFLPQNAVDFGDHTTNSRSLISTFYLPASQGHGVIR